jgi:hypothetical protein
MVTLAQASRAFLALPEAEEKSHMGHPDFRVGGKIFATLQPAKKIAVVMLSPADQAAAVQMNPEALTQKYWGKKGYIEVNLERANAALLRALAQAAWRNIAPKRLVDEMSR